MSGLIDKFQKRYILRGFIDGVLSSLGVVVGASAAIGLSTSYHAASIIIAAGVGGGVANGFSNVLGAFVGEKLVKEIELGEIEKSMLREGGLKGTYLDKKLKRKTFSGSFYDGVSTIIGSLVPVSPFIFGSLITADNTILLYISMFISLVLFFLLGVYIGKISKENIILSGVKMVAFGIVTLAVATLIRMAF